MTRSKFTTVTANDAKLAGIYCGFGWSNNFVECSFHSNGLVALYLDVAVNAVNVLDGTFETNRGSKNNGCIVTSFFVRSRCDRWKQSVSS